MPVRKAISYQFMKREFLPEQVIAEIRLKGCPEGPVLEPLQEQDEIRRKCFSGWETPLAPRGGFDVISALAVVKDDGRTVLEWTEPRRSCNRQRALVAGMADTRDYRVIAEIKPLDTENSPHGDWQDCTEALVGIVFRIRTSRHFYLFGIEGRRRAVLYRRTDNEWFILAEQEVELPDGYVTLEVNLDGDGIFCRCRELGVDFFCTDTTYPEGKAGVRTIGRSRVASLRITQTTSQKERDERRCRVRSNFKRSLAKGIPDPMLVRTLDLQELGGTPRFADFAHPGRYDMLIAGDKLRALTLEGEALWEIPFAVQRIVFSRDNGEQGRLLYGLTGVRSEAEQGLDIAGGRRHTIVSDEMVIIQGKDGKIVARSKVPPLDETVQITDFSPTSGNLTGKGTDIILREWRRDAGGGGFNLWAYNQNLDLLWHNRVKIPYGHHEAVQFYDVNGDGKDELLAGGTLFSAEGSILWVHDLEPEMAKIVRAGHYDAVALGAFAEDSSVDPVAFLVSGSAGVYVVDGLTGRTRMTHRIGHAQGRYVGKVRKDLPGTQILAACRWENMGILTLFSGHGDRLWTIQPDYVGQGSCPVTWGQREEQLIWTNTSGPVQAFYDGHGRMVKDLPELRRLWGNRMRRDVSTGVIHMGNDPTELLSITVEGKMYVFGPK